MRPMPLSRKTSVNVTAASLLVRPVSLHEVEDLVHLERGVHHEHAGEVAHEQPELFGVHRSACSHPPDL